MSTGEPSTHTADFYLGIGTDAVWLGSLSCNADPVFLMWETVSGADALRANDAASYTAAVADMLSEWDDETGSSHPSEDGWPWSCPDSSDTSWVYQFHNGRTWVTPGYAISPQAERVGDTAVATEDPANAQRRVDR